MAAKFLQNDGSIETFNQTVLLEIGNLTYFLRYTLSRHVFSFFVITLKLHENNLSSCEGKEYVRRKLEVYISFNNAKTLLENLKTVVLNF